MELQNCGSVFIYTQGWLHAEFSLLLVFFSTGVPLFDGQGGTPDDQMLLMLDHHAIQLGHLEIVFQALLTQSAPTTNQGIFFLMVEAQCFWDVAIKTNSSKDSINVLVANLKALIGHYGHVGSCQRAQYSGFKLATSTFVLSILVFSFCLNHYVVF